MDRTTLLKKLLPGFVPLFVFIAADEIWGTKIGLFVAIGVGVAEMGWVGFKEKRFDRFILFDTLLLVALGGISIVLNNDLFFKLKPGLIELLLVIILGISAFSSFNIIGLMGQRYLKGATFNEIQARQIQKSLKNLFYIFTGHTLLVFYATFFMSKAAWAFISGGLFYLLFGVYFLYEFLRQRKIKNSTSDEEILPLVDTTGKIVGQAPRSSVHNGSMLLHPVVHMHVISSNKAILLQKRPKSKLIQPGKWDTSVGGHISFGETLEQALQREAYEEIGLTGFSAKLLKTYQWKSDVETELVYLFVTFDHKNYHISSDEVEEARFWTKNQIEKNIEKGIFTPNFEMEFNLLKSYKII
ncbi:MAG: NUDIX hydrolase [Draconibacterium sp.]|nr:MAG: NUDIX hydrolase [Draconibacterium sp.]PIF06028.1 MAG: NUDIX hydrolase [Draconibacterium sp.]